MKIENVTAVDSMVAAMRKGLMILLAFSFSFSVYSQAVTEIITDYKGYWKSSSASNPVKPDNSHNLLAFTYNSTRYSTGVNDDLLSSHGENFIPSDFWAMPVTSISGSINSNTKAGFGALYDGVYNGASNPAPEYGITTYLVDGIKGLNIGTCIANLPVGTMSFAVQNLQMASIGDGIPDIVVTQIADPSGSSFDRYEFVDANGVRVGNYKDIVFTNIPVVGTWTADFYNATNPFVLTSGFTQTDRPLRLWAADLSEFGITETNYHQIVGFRIHLCGNSDVAFVAYNNKSISFQQPLPVRWHFFTGKVENKSAQLDWQTSEEVNADYFEIEKSTDGRTFTAIGRVKAKNLSTVNQYRYSDPSHLSATTYYRLKQVDFSGKTNYSNIVKLLPSGQAVMQVYPNPAKGTVGVTHAISNQNGVLLIYNGAGMIVARKQVLPNTTSTQIDLHGIQSGNYLILLNQGIEKTSTKLMIQ